MGRYDHPLVAQAGSHTTQDRAHIAALDGSGLLAGDGLKVLPVKQRLELQPLELLDEIGRRLVRRPAPGARRIRREAGARRLRATAVIRDEEEGSARWPVVERRMRHKTAEASRDAARPMPACV